MKLKYILIIGLILIILTAGTASAAEDTDDLAAEDTGDEISQVDDIDLTGEDAPGETTENEKERTYWATGMYYQDRYTLNYDDCLTRGVVEGEVKLTGNVSLYIDGSDTPVYNQKAIAYEEDEFDSVLAANKVYMKDLPGLTYGNHSFVFKFFNDDYYQDMEDSGTFEYYYMDVIVPDEVRIGNYDSIHITLPSVATGFVDIYLNDTLFKSIKWDKEYRWGYYQELDDVPFGNYNYTITYRGDSNFESKTFKGSFNVTYPFEVYFENYYINYGECAYATIYLFEDATQPVKITVNGNEPIFVTYDPDDSAVAINNLKTGENVITFTYSDDTHPEKVVTQTVWMDPPYIIPNEIGYNSNDNNISITLPAGAKGNLLVYLESISPENLIANASVVDGTGSCSISNRDLGFYNILVTYEGDYENLTLPVTRTITIVPNIIVPALILEGQDFNITVDIPDEYSITVGFSENFNFEESSITITGKTAIPISGLKTGYYSVSGYYYGFVYKEFPVKGNPKWDMKVNAFSEGELCMFYIIDAPAGLDGVSTLYVDGKKVDLMQTGYGDPIECYLPLGKHTWKLVYSGDSHYDNATCEGTIDVRDFDEVPAMIYAENFKMDYSDGSKYSVKVYGTDGNIAKNALVTFKVNGKKVGTAKTDSKGIASFKFTQTPGNYKISVESLGASATAKLTVKQILTLKKVTVKKSAKKLVITATLKKVKGKYLKGKKITFKFNGKKYTAKTNKKGVAKITIKKSVLKKLKAGKKVKYQATYLKDTVKKSVKVKK